MFWRDIINWRSYCFLTLGRDSDVYGRCWGVGHLSQGQGDPNRHGQDRLPLWRSRHRSGTTQQCKISNWHVMTSQCFYLPRNWSCLCGNKNQPSQPESLQLCHYLFFWAGVFETMFVSQTSYPKQNRTEFQANSFNHVHLAKLVGDLALLILAHSRLKSATTCCLPSQWSVFLRQWTLAST